MIGRQREIAVLWHQIELARAGGLRVALLAGEPGIGKTQLLRELARRAAVEGITVLRGGASDAEGMPPYLPEAVGCSACSGAGEKASSENVAGRESCQIFCYTGCRRTESRTEPRREAGVRPPRQHE